jgi:phosphoglycolate phosphatase
MPGKARSIVLLDLDGTLTKSDPGIQASIEYACKVMKFPVPSQEELMRFMGPPIAESMERNGMAKADLPKAVAAYRKAYSTPMFPDPKHPGEMIPGMYLNSVYAGIPEALTTLRKQGYILATATAKPEPQAIPVCNYLGLTSQVDYVFGASLDATRVHKADVIRYAFASLGYSPEDGDRAVMVGDRWTDVDGAHEVDGLDTIGVRWGYAEPGELEEHGAAAYAKTPYDLPDAVNAYFERK